MRRLPALLIPLALLIACGGSSARNPPEQSPAQGRTDPGADATAAAAPRLLRIGRFDQPLYVTAPPGDRRRVFVVEQSGRIIVLRGGRKLPTPFLDIRSRVSAGGEAGLLSLAFAPDYASTGRFYVYFTGRDGRQNVVEYRRATADRADASSARLVLRMDDSESNHNGGFLLFGQDRLLYIATGDGGGGDDQHGARGNAQDLGSLLGKILRIDPRPSGTRRYRVPATNPFTGRAGARPEIYAYGLRNPWRFAFDRTTGAMAIGDVGQDRVEEIDFVGRARARGANFGWRPFEGSSRNFDEPATGAIGPVIEHSHDDGWCSITGGVFVRDPRLPALAGRYVYGDFCQGRIRIAKLRSPRATSDRALGLPVVQQLASFGEDASRRVYVVSLAGPVYRLVAG